MEDLELRISRHNTFNILFKSLATINFSWIFYAIIVATNSPSPRIYVFVLWFLLTFCLLILPLLLEFRLPEYDRPSKIQQKTTSKQRDMQKIAVESLQELPPFRRI